VNAKRRYVAAGTGHRSRMYLDAIAGPHRDDADLVGLIEPNPGRRVVQLKRLAAAGLDPDPIVTGAPDDLEAVITKAGADRLIVTAPDFTHAELITRGLAAGVDVVVEKPLTIDPPSTRRIAEAVQRSGRHVVVTHNYRYSPRNSGLKEIVKSGAIGTPLSVTFEWVLDTAHGADYFRRWHRDKVNSGGLLIQRRTTSTWSTGCSPMRRCRCTPGAGSSSTARRTRRPAGWRPAPSAAPTTGSAAPGSSTSAPTRPSGSSTTTTRSTTAIGGTRTSSVPA
jgi:hypothetical protein